MPLTCPHDAADPAGRRARDPAAITDALTARLLKSAGFGRLERRTGRCLFRQ